MNQINDVQTQIIDLINLFEHKKHELQERPAVGKKNLVFADVVLINKTGEDPTVDSWYARRVVRTDMPQVFIWLFKKFASIVRDIPGYYGNKEEVFGRLGNTVSMVEAFEPPLKSRRKNCGSYPRLLEICQDLFEGRMQSFDVALGAEIMDDFVTRSIKSGFIDQETFEKQLFGEAN